jgi:hypothetical protein
MRKGSRVLRIGAYVPVDDNNQRLVYPGLVVAYETSAQSYYVPYSAGASYGATSNVAVGVLGDEGVHNATLGDPIIDPIFHGKLIEAHCYEQGGTVGTLTASAKTDLTLVEWV